MAEAPTTQVWRGFGRKGGARVQSFIGVVVKGQGPSRDAGLCSLLQKHQVSPLPNIQGLRISGAEKLVMNVRCPRLKCGGAAHSATDRMPRYSSLGEWGGQ